MATDHNPAAHRGDGLQTALVVLGTAILTSLMPSLVFLSVALSEGMEVPFAALLEQFGAERHNLRGITIFSLLPCLLLAVLVGFRWRFVRGSCPLYALGGAVPIVLVTAFVNYQFWPSYLPARTFLGFPHGLEFVIGPLFFAPIGVVIGLVATFVALRRRR